MALTDKGQPVVKVPYHVVVPVECLQLRERPRSNLVRVTVSLTVVIVGVCKKVRLF